MNKNPQDKGKAPNLQDDLVELLGQALFEAPVGSRTATSVASALERCAAWRAEDEPAVAEELRMFTAARTINPPPTNTTGGQQLDRQSRLDRMRSLFRVFAPLVGAQPAFRDGGAQLRLDDTEADRLEIYPNVEVRVGDEGSALVVFTPDIAARATADQIVVLVDRGSAFSDHTVTEVNGMWHCTVPNWSAGREFFVASLSQESDRGH